MFCDNSVNIINETLHNACIETSYSWLVNNFTILNTIGVIIQLCHGNNVVLTKTFPSLTVDSFVS